MQICSGRRIRPVATSILCAISVVSVWQFVASPAIASKKIASSVADSAASIARPRPAYSPTPLVLYCAAKQPAGKRDGISVWVYGDGKGANIRLRAFVSGGAAAAAALPIGSGGDTEALWPTWFSAPIPINFTGWKQIYVPAAQLTYRAPAGTSKDALPPGFETADTIGIDTNRRAGALVIDDVAWGNGESVQEDFESGIGNWRIHGTPEALSTVSLRVSGGTAHSGTGALKIDFSGYGKSVAASLSYLSKQAALTSDPYVVFAQQSPLQPVTADALPNPGDASQNLSAFACADQIQPISFTIYAKSALTNVSVAPLTQLKCAGKSLGPDAIDIDVVKFIRTHGSEAFIDPDSTGSYQGLLVKDDHEELSAASGSLPALPSPRTTGDASTDIPANTQKQFWATVRVPRNATPGEYKGQLKVTGDQFKPFTIDVTVNVLPLHLMSSSKQYVITFDGRLGAQPDGSAAQITRYLSPDLFSAELKDIADHDIRYTTINDKGPDLWKAVDAYSQAGLAMPLVYTGFDSPDEAKAVESERKEKLIDDFIYFDRNSAGLASDAADLKAHHIKAAGIPMDNDSAEKLDVVIYGLGHPYVNQLVKSGGLRTSEKRDWLYWRSAQTDNRLNRIYSGMYLWDANLYGAFLSDYQSAANANPYDDSLPGNGAFRPQMLSYPTQTGVIDTVGWEAVREGVTDVRYLTTFYAALRQCKDAKIAKALVNSMQYSVEFFMKKPLLNRSDAEIQKERLVIANDTIKLQKLLGAPSKRPAK